MYKYRLYYDGGFLCDSAEINDGYTYDSEEEAEEEAQMEIESRIDYWEIDGVQYEKELFEYIDSAHPEIIESIAATKDLTEDNEIKLKETLSEFEEKFLKAR